MNWLFSVDNFFYLLQELLAYSLLGLTLTASLVLIWLVFAMNPVLLLSAYIVFLSGGANVCVIFSTCLLSYAFDYSLWFILNFITEKTRHSWNFCFLCIMLSSFPALPPYSVFKWLVYINQSGLLYHFLVCTCMCVFEDRFAPWGMHGFEASTPHGYHNGHMFRFLIGKVVLFDFNLGVSSCIL